MQLIQMDPSKRERIWRNLRRVKQRIGGNASMRVRSLGIESLSILLKLQASLTTDLIHIRIIHDLRTTAKV